MQCMHNSLLNCTAVAFAVVLILEGGGGPVPQPKGAQKFLKGEPKGKPILSKKGTKRGTKRHKRGPKHIQLVMTRNQEDG